MHGVEPDPDQSCVGPWEAMQVELRLRPGRRGWSGVRSIGSLTADPVADQRVSMHSRAARSTVALQR